MAETSFWKLFWENLKSNFIVKFLVQYPLAILAAFVVIVGGLVALRLGITKDLNIGGILKWLFSKPGTKHSVVAAANTVPSKRVDQNGDPIPVGTPDQNGWTQWEVKEFKTSANPLRDKSVIQTTAPSGETVEVKLPEGVKDTDVDQVIEVHPEVYVVKTKTESAVHAKDLLDRLPKPKEAK